MFGTQVIKQMTFTTVLKAINIFQCTGNFIYTIVTYTPDSNISTILTIALSSTAQVFFIVISIRRHSNIAKHSSENLLFYIWRINIDRSGDLAPQRIRNLWWLVDLTSSFGNHFQLHLEILATSISANLQNKLKNTQKCYLTTVFCQFNSTSNMIYSNIFQTFIYSFVYPSLFIAHIRLFSKSQKWFYVQMRNIFSYKNLKKE